MKKVLIMLVSAVMLFSMTACSSKKSEEIQEPGIENSEEKASVSSEVPQKTDGYEYGVTEDGYTIITNLDTSKDVTLTMAGWEGGPSETDNLNRALELFSEYYPNIKVEYTPSADSGEGHHGKIMTMFSTVVHHMSIILQIEELSMI